MHFVSRIFVIETDALIECGLNTVDNVNTYDR